MIRSVHFGDDVLDFAFFIDDNCGPDYPHVFLAVHRFLAPSAILLNDFMLCIGDERKWQFEFIDELLVAGSGVCTDPNDFKAVVTQQSVIIAQIAGLCCTAGGVVFGIEENDQLAPIEILQADFLVVLVKACECRRFAP